MSRVIDRRQVLRAGAGVVALALVPAARADVPGEVAATIGELVGNAPVVDGGITFIVPETAENGAVVPVTVAVDSPMTEADHVRAIHLVATRNPTPGVASYRFTPASGRALVTARIRLAESQTVLAYAVHGDGTVRRAAAAVRISIGGCLT